MASAGTTVTPTQPNVPRVDPANRRLALIGNIVSGIGVVSFLGSVASLVVMHDAAEKQDYPQGDHSDAQWKERRERFASRERAARISAIATGAGALGLVGGGVAMIVIAQRREAERRERLGITAWAPVIAPGYGGVQWIVRW